MRELIIIALLLSLVGCKTYEFKAQNKSELAKICAKEFPPSDIPHKIERDTVIDYQDRIVEVDCDELEGVQEVPCKDSVKTIVETRYVKDVAQWFYTLELEHKLEKAEEALAENKAETKKHIAEIQKTANAKIKEAEKETKKANSKVNRYKLVMFILGAVGCVIMFRR